MKVTLHYQLFLAILTATLAVVVYMTLIMQWSFDRGFLNYVNVVEQGQLGKIAADLEKHYRQSKSWTDFSSHPEKMAIIIVSSYPEGKLKERFLERIQSEKLPKKLVPTGPPPDDMPPHFLPRVFLLDAEKKTVFGFDPEDTRQDMIKLYFQNRVVGYLGAHPAKNLAESHQLIFAKQQKVTLLLVAIAGFLIAAGLSLPIAYRITGPIRELARATRELSLGRYDTRIDIKSSNELGQLSQDVNNLAEILEKNQQARSQWFADISHELRTPIAVLRGKIEALQDGIYKPTTETLGSLHQEILYLGMLVEDLYQLSLTDLGAMSYHRVEVQPTWALEQSIAVLLPQLEEKELRINTRFELDENTTLFGDNERLKQLFTNLMANSIRYTDEGGQIDVHVHQQEKVVIFDIQDSAPGVSTEHLPRLFERLYRVDSSRSRNFGGAGLGLSICFNIVEGHNGTIKARNSDLGGLWISVSLPLAE